MNLNVICSIMLHIIICSWVNCSTPCSIFVSLNCSCFQSNFDLHSSFPTKTYSHLYCQGNSLTKKTFESPFGFDFENQNRFRTISIEFNLPKNIQIYSNQFHSLAFLFSQTHYDAQVQISIRLNNFTKIKFARESFTSNMFEKKHQKRHLKLYFSPKARNSIENESGENVLSNFNDQFEFSSNSFSGLIVSELNLYIHTSKDHLSPLYPFEYIFNNTNIDELHFDGSIILPGPPDMRRLFKGSVKSLTLHRHVDTIDSSTFPYYFSVYSYNIHSIEAHSMDLDSFIPLYNNLRGLNLILPRFEVSINRLIPTLESLSLDIEYLNKQTLLSARHINYLKLGSRLRRVNDEVFYSLSNHLKHLDLSEIDLSEMISDSRCYLIHFIYQNFQRSINLILPRIKYSNECDCARLILHDLQSIKDQKENSICSKQCRFSDCPIIGQYFRKKSPLFIDHRPQIHSSANENNEDLPSVDLFDDPIDVHMMRFLINQTNEQQIDSDRRRTTTTTTTRIRIPLRTVEDFDLINEEQNEFKHSKETKSFFWSPFLIGLVLVLFAILFLIIIIVIIVRSRKSKDFIAVPAYV